MGVAVGVALGPTTPGSLGHALGVGLGPPTVDRSGRIHVEEGPTASTAMTAAATTRAGIIMVGSLPEADHRARTYCGCGRAAAAAMIR